MWLVQQVPPNSTVRINGEATIIRSYFVGKNKDGEKVHYLIDDMGDAYHISQIRDYQTGLNPYEDFLKNEPKDIKPVKDVQEETTEETAEETQDGQDEVKYSTVEEDETHEKTDEEWREEALAASKEKLDKDQARWEKQVDTFLQKPAESVEESKNPLFIMDSPVLFDLFGVERLPVYIEEMTLHKILYGSHENEDLLNALKNIPQLLTSPAAVVVNYDKSGKTFAPKDQVLIFTTARINGKSLNIAFRFNRVDDTYKTEIMTEEEWRKQVEKEKEYPRNKKNRSGKYATEYSGNRSKTFFMRKEGERLATAIDNGELLFWDAKKGAALYRGAVNVDPQPDKENSFVESIIANGRPYVKSKEERLKIFSEKNLKQYGLTRDRAIQLYLEQLKKDAADDIANGRKNTSGKRIYTPQDLEEHIVNAYRNRNEVRYSEATGENETHKYSESEVQEAFKGQDVTRTDNGYEITFSNGNKLVITETGEVRRPDRRRGGACAGIAGKKKLRKSEWWVSR